MIKKVKFQNILQIIYLSFRFLHSDSQVGRISEIKSSPKSRPLHHLHLGNAWWFKQRPTKHNASFPIRFLTRNRPALFLEQSNLIHFHRRWGHKRKRNPRKIIYCRKWALHQWHCRKSGLPWKTTELASGDAIFESARACA